MRQVADVVMSTLASLLTRVFFRHVEIEGADRLPREGPAVLVANHTNGLIDALLLMTTLRRFPRFLGKSTLWRITPLRPFLWLAGAVPVYRPADGEGAAGNDATFRTCRQLLARGGVVALFPEGISHNEPALQPLRTGAARIALGAADGGTTGVVTVAIGLVYDAKARFRSRALVRVGVAHQVDPWVDRYRNDGHATVRAFTEDLAQQLQAVVTTYRSWQEAQLLNGIADLVIAPRADAAGSSAGDGTSGAVARRSGAAARGDGDIADHSSNARPTDSHNSRRAARRDGDFTSAAHSRPAAGGDGDIADHGSNARPTDGANRPPTTRADGHNGRLPYGDNDRPTTSADGDDRATPLADRERVVASLTTVDLDASATGRALQEAYGTYQRDLALLGLTDGQITARYGGHYRRAVGLSLFKILVALPLGLIGAVIHVVPYRLMKWIATKPANESIKATVKVGGCFAAFTLIYLAVAELARRKWGPAAAVTAFLGAPLSGYAALTLSERVKSVGGLVEGAATVRSRQMVLPTVLAHRAEVVRLSTEVVVAGCP